jgi:hypothetical protein
MEGSDTLQKLEEWRLKELINFVCRNWKKKENLIKLNHGVHIGDGGKTVKKDSSVKWFFGSLRIWRIHNSEKSKTKET